MTDRERIENFCRRLLNGERPSGWAAMQQVYAYFKVKGPLEAMLFQRRK